jgi:hypothetical protein
MIFSGWVSVLAIEAKPANAGTSSTGADRADSQARRAAANFAQTGCETPRRYSSATSWPIRSSSADCAGVGLLAAGIPRLRALLRRVRSIEFRSAGRAAVD